VLELAPVYSTVLGCHANPSALDRLATRGGMALRVAPSELLLVGGQARLDGLTGELQAVDRWSLVVDLTSAFAIWALRGDARLEAFSRLSAVRLPDSPGVAQGLVAHVPARVFALQEELLILVSASLAHHLRERVLTACGDLAPSERRALTLDAVTEPATLA
jgi:hypothetical protein